METEGTGVADVIGLLPDAETKYAASGLNSPPLGGQETGDIAIIWGVIADIGQASGYHSLVDHSPIREKDIGQNPTITIISFFGVFQTNPFALE